MTHKKKISKIICREWFWWWNGCFEMGEWITYLMDMAKQFRITWCIRWNMVNQIHIRCDAWFLCLYMYDGRCCAESYVYNRSKVYRCRFGFLFWFDVDEAVRHWLSTFWSEFARRRAGSFFWRFAWLIVTYIPSPLVQTLFLHNKPPGFIKQKSTLVGGGSFWNPGIPYVGVIIH